MASSKIRQAGFSLLELSLAIAIGLAILASTFWMMKQHNTETRIQQSKMLLATVRTGLEASRYRYGAYPPAASLSANDGGGGQRLVAGVATLSEPVSGMSRILTATNAANAGTGGWVYDPTTGTLRANLNPASHPGDNPLLW